MTRRVVVFAVLGLVLAALETSLLAAFGIHRFALHLGLGLIVYLAVKAGGIDGAVGSALVGYAMDVFGGTPPGLSVFLAEATFVGVRLFSQALDVPTPLLAFVGAAAQAAFSVGAVVLLAMTARLGDVGFSRVAGTVAWDVLASAVCVPLVYHLAGAVDRRLVADESGEAWLR